MSQFWHRSAKQVAFRILLEGRVQGVGCRAQVLERVTDIGHMSGFVRNLENGTVEICVNGDDTRIESLLKVLRNSLAPPVQVERVLSEQISELEVKQLDLKPGFRIRRD